MTETQALAVMIAPGAPRPTKWLQGVIQILVTSSCDKSCFGCTQASQLRRKPWFMTPDQFRGAVLSLDGYFGVVGVFGGNPAISPHFADYCAILRELVPFERRGLWCNNPLGKAAEMRRTFNPAFSNLNCHLDREAYDEFMAGWPESHPFGHDRDSRHSPPWVAIKDVIEDEGERWDLISRCDINRTWSAGVGVFRGQLRAWFCEIAMAQSILHQDEPDYPDTGLKFGSRGEVLLDSELGPMSLVSVLRDDLARWWELPMTAFSHQARKHCHDCGVPMAGYGELAQAADGKEQVSQTHAAVFQPKKKGRAVELVTTREQLGEPLALVTDYLGNAKR